MKRVFLLAVACLAVPVTPAAWAQSSNPASLQPPGVGRARDKAPRQPPPPALPGSRAEPTAVAPADRAAADLPPTEALFDSINRGDLASAKDALSRGADLNATNVLGLTPLDLSIDLGRNEISFLLLSLRGGSGYNVSGEPGEATPPHPPTRAERLAAQRAERAAQRAARPAVAARPPAAPAPQSPRLFSGNGGGPVPQAGFLGFDAGR